VSDTAPGDASAEQRGQAEVSVAATEEKSKPGIVFTIRACGDRGQHAAPHGHYLSLVIAHDQRQHTACECGVAFSIVESHEMPKLESEVVAHWNAIDGNGCSDQPAAAEFSPVLPFDAAAERMALAQIDAGAAPLREDAPLILARRGLVHAGKESLRLTDLGKARLATLNAAAVPADDDLPPIVTTDDLHQIDLEEAIAAKAKGDPLDIPPFLARTAEAAS